MMGIDPKILAGGALVGFSTEFGLGRLRAAGYRVASVVCAKLRLTLKSCWRIHHHQKRKKNYVSIIFPDACECSLYWRRLARPHSSHRRCGDIASRLIGRQHEGCKTTFAVTLTAIHKRKTKQDKAL
ncbi:MAG: hypothetical protein NT154_07055 [Verrucomicrobia bacterium]|nr:hypothetical protein [Verrucomicrobiota bacterium]